MRLQIEKTQNYKYLCLYQSVRVWYGYRMPRKCLERTKRNNNNETQAAIINLMTMIHNNVNGFKHWHRHSNA